MLFVQLCILLILLVFSLLLLISIELFAVEHNHEEDISRVEAAQQAGCLIYRSINSIDAKMEKFSFDCTMIEYNTKDTT